MIVKNIKGDLVKLATENYFNGIAHGCNCFHTMGSGIAPLINNYTSGSALTMDKLTPFGDINKLGTLSIAAKCSMLDPVPEGHSGGHVTFVYNLYTQFTTKRYENEVCVHWESFENALVGALEHCVHASGDDVITFGIPHIGLGLAGGKKEDFDKVIKNVEKVFRDYDNLLLFIVEFDKG